MVYIYLHKIRLEEEKLGGRGMENSVVKSGLPSTEAGLRK